MSTVVRVSEEYTHRSQSWCFTGIYRNHSGLYEVNVKKDAYADQSHAKISVWRGKWEFFCSLPTEQWFSVLPSYTKRELSDEDRGAFIEIRNTLLSKLALGLWSDKNVNITGEAA